MSARPRWRPALAALLAAPALLGAAGAGAADAAGARPRAATPIGQLGARRPLLYQLLIGEMALDQRRRRHGLRAGSSTPRAAARDEALFRRAVDIALQARAGEQALAATRAWRLARPESLDALRLQLQILLVLNRNDGIAEPLQALLAQTPASRAARRWSSALPRFLQRASDPRRVAGVLEESLKPYRDDRGHAGAGARGDGPRAGSRRANPTVRWRWRRKRRRWTPRRPARRCWRWS